MKELVTEQDISVYDKYRIWLEATPEASRTHYGFLQAIQPRGLPDFWDGEFDRHRTYDLECIVDMLFARLVHHTREPPDYSPIEPYLQVIMDKNVGSIVYDW